MSTHNGYNDFTVYITVIGSKGMQAKSWNGHSVETYMSLPSGLTKEEIRKYIIDSMIIEWEKTNV